MQFFLNLLIFLTICHASFCSGHLPESAFDIERDSRNGFLHVFEASKRAAEELGLASMLYLKLQHRDMVKECANLPASSQKLNLSPYKAKTTGDRMTIIVFGLKAVTRTNDIVQIINMMKGKTFIWSEYSVKMELHHINDDHIIMLPKPFHRSNLEDTKIWCGDTLPVVSGTAISVEKANHPNKPVKSKEGTKAYYNIRKKVLRAMGTVAAVRYFGKKYEEVKKAGGNWEVLKQAAKKLLETVTDQHEIEALGLLGHNVCSASVQAVMKGHLSRSGHKHAQKPSSTGFSPKKKKSRREAGDNREDGPIDIGANQIRAQGHAEAPRKRAVLSVRRDITGAFSTAGRKHAQKPPKTGFSPEKKKSRRASGDNKENHPIGTGVNQVRSQGHVGSPRKLFS
ncbi:MAG: hypothetical protein ACPGXY_00005 [Alphaproteobacteria bacterium]